MGCLSWWNFARCALSTCIHRCSHILNLSTSWELSIIIDLMGSSRLARAQVEPLAANLGKKGYAKAAAEVKAAQDELERQRLAAEKRAVADALEAAHRSFESSFEARLREAMRNEMCGYEESLALLQTQLMAADGRVKALEAAGLAAVSQLRQQASALRPAAAGNVGSEEGGDGASSAASAADVAMATLSGVLSLDDRLPADATLAAKGGPVLQQPAGRLGRALTQTRSWALPKSSEPELGTIEKRMRELEENYRAQLESARADLKEARTELALAKGEVAAVRYARDEAEQRLQQEKHEVRLLADPKSYCDSLNNLIANFKQSDCAGNHILKHFARQSYYISSKLLWLIRNILFIHSC